MNKYSEETILLNYSHLAIQKLIDNNKWRHLNEQRKIARIYLFVRDKILFGYNKSDDIRASEILKDGYGQCNTKSTLLMALLRAVDIHCRLHGFTINKDLQKGIIPDIGYKFAPENLVHSWVEINYKNKWHNLEGVILDKKYLTKLQKKFKNCNGTFCGYGVYTDNFQNPEINWNEGDTYIQKLGINQDLGVYNNPDELYKEHQQDFSLIKKIIFNLVMRKLMNKNVDKIRNE